VPELRNLIYWNKLRMSELLVQTRPTKERLTLDSFGVSVDGSGSVRLDGKLERRPLQYPRWTDVLDAVLDGLRDADQLFGVRPETIDAYLASNANYVFEEIDAVRVVLPVGQGRINLGYPEELTVWISEPPPRVGDPIDELDLFGAFLYLVEEDEPEREVQRPRKFASAASALATLVGSIRQVDLELDHELGCASAKHPIEKLEALGGRSSLKRNIQTLYQVRYMSNKQRGWRISEGRVHDLLAYTLAIYT
jgi:hypothetical protein